MSDDVKGLSGRIEKLSREVEALTGRVDAIEKMIEVSPAVRRGDEPGAASTVISAEGTAFAPKPGGLTTGGMAAILSRFTAVSIILLFALLLRTLTDNGMVGVTLGSILGVLYASLLEGTGLIMYSRSHSFAPIFSVSGGLLLFSVVYETHAGFGSIPSLAAYLMLILAAGGMAVISHKYRAAIPVSVGTIGIIAAGIPIDFPSPNFLYLAGFLLAVNIIAFSAVDLPKCRWLRVVAFSVTTLSYLAWDYKMFTYRETGVALGGPYSSEWFIPSLTVMSAFYVGFVFLRIPRKKEERLGAFDSILPTLTSAWAYMLARFHLQSDMGTMVAVGAFGTFIAVVFMTMAYVIVRRREAGASGINALVFPAAFLMAISFRDLSGESVIALAVLSLAAYGLSSLSVAWDSAGIRVTSYFLQGTVMGASFILLTGNPPGASPVVTIAAMASISAVSFFHYRRSRKVAPPLHSLFFSRIDRLDRSALILLLVSLTSAFLAFRAIAYGVLGGPTDAFRCAQSIIINIGAALLFLKAYRRGSVEIRNVAAGVTVIGAVKVFVVDLLATRGIPLVLGVLSFVLAAAIGSAVLSRWHRHVED
ncbi:MAG TPA: hypothetical protein ENH32_06115 [Proteobacteria bacterium]|nr:hypothetical protein BMS3Abin14_01287 [bacterium BMS3Abin14]HDL53532.1 hypothetical protein [Pseudomonadota bacterium]